MWEVSKPSSGRKAGRKPFQGIKLRTYDAKIIRLYVGPDSAKKFGINEGDKYIVLHDSENNRIAIQKNFGGIPFRHYHGGGFYAIAIPVTVPVRRAGVPIDNLVNIIFNDDTIRIEDDKIVFDLSGAV